MILAMSFFVRYQLWSFDEASLTVLESALVGTFSSLENEISYDLGIGEKFRQDFLYMSHHVSFMIGIVNESSFAKAALVTSVIRVDSFLKIVKVKHYFGFIWI